MKCAARPPDVDTQELPSARDRVKAQGVAKLNERIAPTVKAFQPDGERQPGERIRGAALDSRGPRLDCVAPALAVVKRKAEVEVSVRVIRA